MRFAVVNTIYEAGLKNEQIFFITGDLGHAKTENFQKEWVSRYFNAGMSEQNIIGMAAGLSLCGKKVFVYSIVPFITLRCLEQIKIDICIQNVDVTVIGIGGGFAYGSAGGTHHSIEEIAALRALPNMKIICPATPYETEVLTRQIIDVGGPSYIRIGRGKESNLDGSYSLQIGKAAIIRPGRDISLIASGTILLEALRAAEILGQNGIDAEVVNMHTIKPLDDTFVLHSAESKKAMFTLEEHNVIGGLGSAVSEVLMGSRIRPEIFHSFGVADAWPKKVGSQRYLRDVSGISAERVAQKITALLQDNYGHH